VRKSFSRSSFELGRALSFSRGSFELEGRKSRSSLDAVIPSAFMRVGSSGGGDRLAVMTNSHYYPACTKERLEEAQRQAAAAGDWAVPPTKPAQHDKLALMTNPYALPPCSEASLRKAQIEAARHKGH
jgi:hypothetical protein